MIDHLDRLEQPLPQGIRCAVRVVLRKDDDGITFNKVKTFAVVGIDALEQDAFAPKAEMAGESSVKIPPETRRRHPRPLRTAAKRGRGAHEDF